MTPAEYIQLKAFARIDGALLSVLWMLSFACYIVGLTSQTFSLIAMVLAFFTPFFVGHRLRLFRDFAREGIISFKRSWAYVVLMFFYGSLLFALAVFAYFAYLDQGYVLHVLQQMMEAPEMKEALKQLGMEKSMEQLVSELGMVRPIDVAINLLTSNIIIGMFLGLPIGVLLRSNGNKK